MTLRIRERLRLRLLRSDLTQRAVESRVGFSCGYLSQREVINVCQHYPRSLSTDQRDFATYRWKERQPFENLLFS